MNFEYDSLVDHWHGSSPELAIFRIRPTLTYADGEVREIHPTLDGTEILTVYTDLGWTVYGMGL